ncbi:Hypothetical protein POVN_LOCUS330 [uncultured virus]|nr:Hypothetical protein POVN_LOCUS330 [uncultured virus]
MSYSLVAVRCYTGVTLTEEEKKLIHERVHGKHGAASLYPEVLTALVTEMKAKDEPRMLAAVALEVFRQIVLAEHRVAQLFFDKYGEGCSVVKKGAQLYHQAGDTPYVAGMAEEVAKGWAVTPLPTGNLNHLMEILGEEDSNKFFDFPAEKGDEVEPDRKDFKYEVREAFKLSPLVNALLETEFSVSGTHFNTAIVCVDAQYRYCGHVYAWATGTTVNTAMVLGIRSSFVNLVCRHVKDVSLKIFHGVALWAKTHQFEHIEVQSPFPVMRKILDKRMGFRESDEGMSNGTGAVLAHFDESKVSFVEYGVPLFEFTRKLVETDAFKTDCTTLVSMLKPLYLEKAKEERYWMNTCAHNQHGKRSQHFIQAAKYEMVAAGLKAETIAPALTLVLATSPLHFVVEPSQQRNSLEHLIFYYLTSTRHDFTKKDATAVAEPGLPLPA